MSDKGILFSAPMVRALLAGTKTQTRRLLANPEYYGCPTGDCPHETQAECDVAMAGLSAKETRFAVGDRLYVREAWSTEARHDHRKPRELHQQQAVYLRSTDEWLFEGHRIHQSLRDHPGAQIGRYRPGMFMPRWASRITLNVTEVRVQRLQDISEADGYAEGIPHDYGESIHGPDGYRDLWSTLHTKPGERWEDNPWVVATSFSVRHGNIDQVAP